MKVIRPTDKISVYRGDNMDFFKNIPDKQYDWAIVDPPYFDGPQKREFFGYQISPIGVRRDKYSLINSWKIPDREFFVQINRISKNQIIFGINYFTHLYDFGPGRIIWDKVNGASSFSDAEIAYCSTHETVRLFRFMWNGMMQGKSISEGHLQRGDKSKNQKRIHQCEKPVELYKWLINSYCKTGDKIIDPYSGSLSIGMACHDFNYYLDAIELDPRVYQSSVNRLKDYVSQLKLPFYQD
jgi:site-specific DNA-methyltransferase (adenine-specific)